MAEYTPDFSLAVEGVKGACPAGEAYAKRNIEAKTIPVFDALPLYKNYTDIFLMDDVPEQERKEVARQVADKIIARLRQEGPH